MTDTRSVHVRISGRVQGVSYRAWMLRRANRLGLSGWVRNLRTGDVEAALSGPASAVEALLVLCREGPRQAKVEKVEVLDSVATVTGAFVIRED
jgi:acylphosphatase